MNFFIQRRYFLKENHRKYVEEYNYLYNSKYHAKTSIYPLYTKERKIVMLGSSLTDNANWDELLDRSDIANRGIGGDVSEGMLERMNYVINVKPQICFIESGINDIAKGFSDEIILENLNSIIDILEENNIIPVLNTVSFITSESESKRRVSRNKNIKRLNDKIIHLAQEKNISIIDLNTYISKNNALMPEFAIDDRIHLSDLTYEIWTAEIQRILNEKGI